MTYRWIESINEFQDISGLWDKALADSREDNPFLLSDFILIWWKYYENGRKLKVFVAEDDGAITAGIPLCLEKRFLRNTLVHMGGVDANLTHFFSLDKKLNFFDKLMEYLSGKGFWDNLILPRVLCNNALIGQIGSVSWRSYAQYGFYLADAGLNGIIDLQKGYDGVINNVSRRLVRYLHSAKNEAEKLGKLKLSKADGAVNIDRLFKEFRGFSIRSFRSRNNVSAFENPAYANFYAELLQTLDKKQMLDAHKLTAGEVTLGISFGYRFGKGFKWILTSFNPSFYKMRPGHLLLDFLVREAIENGDPYFDMYYGGEVFYKQQWCNNMVPLQKAEIYRRNLFNKSLIWGERTLRSNNELLGVLRRLRNTAYKIKYANSNL